MLGPAPSARGEPSIWYAEVALPQRNRSGNVKAGFKSVSSRSGSDSRQKNLPSKCRGAATVHQGISENFSATLRVSNVCVAAQEPNTTGACLETDSCKNYRCRRELMSEITFDRVRKVYDNGHVAVKNATFEVGAGELLVLVGPSGCGKSTLLRIIAGLEAPTAGTLSIGGRVVNNVPAKDRDVAMVFQSYALYPHMSVADNLGFGLKLRKLPKVEIRQRVQSAAEKLGLTGVLSHRPGMLSGGQRQRVALGRAIVRNPRVFL